MDKEKAFNILRGLTLASGLDMEEKQELLNFINNEEGINSIVECEEDGMKEFYGEVSLAARIYFRTKGASKEEAKEKVLSTVEIDINLCEEGVRKNGIEITDMEWNLIEQAQQGNIREPYIDDIEIYEEE